MKSHKQKICPLFPVITDNENQFWRNHLGQCHCGRFFLSPRTLSPPPSLQCLCSTGVISASSNVQLHRIGGEEIRLRNVRPAAKMLRSCQVSLSQLAIIHSLLLKANEFWLITKQLSDAGSMIGWFHTSGDFQ